MWIRMQLLHPCRKKNPPEDRSVNTLIQNTDHRPGRDKTTAPRFTTRLYMKEHYAPVKWILTEYTNLYERPTGSKYCQRVPITQSNWWAMSILAHQQWCHRAEINYVDVSVSIYQGICKVQCYMWRWFQPIPQASALVRLQYAMVVRHKDNETKILSTHSSFIAIAICSCGMQIVHTENMLFTVKGTP